MVNLIITLISIALVAIIAVATLYNGGDAFREGASKAGAAQLVNAAQQISAANIFYANDNAGGYAADLATLTLDGKYLASIPRVPTGATLAPDSTGEADYASNLIAVELVDNKALCESINEQANISIDPLPASATAVLTDNVFGCFEDAVGAGPYHFVFQ